MKPNLIFRVVSYLIVLSVLAGCGPKVDATVTTDPINVRATPEVTLESTPTVATPTESPTITPLPTATNTPTPTTEPTATEVPFPAEWQTLIDHTEELPDGRLVAIAAPTVDGQDAVRRVLQLNENGEWIAYVPELFFNRELDQSTFPDVQVPMPEADITRIHFNEDEAQLEVPLGYLGKSWDDPEHTQWTYWLGGTVVGVDSYPADVAEISRAIAVQVPLPNGDQIIIKYRVANFNMAGTRIYSLDTFSPGIDGQTLAEAGLGNTVGDTRFIRQSAIWRFIQENPQALIGQQIVVGINSGDGSTPMSYSEESPYSSRAARESLIGIFTQNVPPTTYLEGIVNLSVLDGLILPSDIINQIIY